MLGVLDIKTDNENLVKIIIDTLKQVQQVLNICFHFPINFYLTFRGSLSNGWRRTDMMFNLLCENDKIEKKMKKE